MRKLALLFGLPALGAALSALWPAVWSAAALAQEAPPAFVSRHETHAEDAQAIQRLLKAYTTAMKNGDRALFESLLLDEQIPFSSTDEMAGHKDGTDTRHYASFRDAVFASGARYTQSHYNVHIAQDGPLAQVSLDFVTQKADGRGAYGWKLLQLVKIQGQWKIASELYTARAWPVS